MSQTVIYFADINDPDETGTEEPNFCDVVLAADYDTQTKRVAELEGLLRDARPPALAPAAAAVMPERMTSIPEGKTISYAAGYEAALDAVARLNRHPVPLELLERIANKQDAAAFIGQEQIELRAILGADR